MRIFSAGGNLRSWEKRDGSRASCSSGSCSSTGLDSSTSSLEAAPLLQLLANPRHQAAHVEELVHELRESLAAVLVAFREVAHDTLLEVHLELVTVLDRLGGLGRLEDGISHVDRVAKKDPCERVGDHQR